MLDAICIGEMLVDFLPGNEEGLYIRKAGGAPANMAVAAVRAGVKAGFCGKVGRDDFGRFLTKTLEDNDVMVLCRTPVESATTTMAFVTVKSDGSRSFTFARKPGADMFLSIEDVDAAGLENTRLIHVCSCSLSKPPASDATEYAVKKGHELGKLISLDVNYRSLLWDGDRPAAREAVKRLLPYVDMMKISEEELDFAGGVDNIHSLAEENGIALVVETLAAKGARCYWNGETLYSPGIEAQCVDGTGAGDAFWGCFIARLLKLGVDTPGQLTRELIEDAMVWGNVGGSLCVRKKGAMESLPCAADITALRRELGI